MQQTNRQLTDEERKEATAANRQKLLLQATLEGAVRAERSKVKRRINWDTEARSELRERIAKSWVEKNDMFRGGEAFSKFCERVGINVCTLRRYLKVRGDEYVAKKRGRKSLLTESVMRHICERELMNNLKSFLQIYHRVDCVRVAVSKQHDDKSEGLSRAQVIAMVQKASGYQITLTQAGHTWDRTIHPLGVKFGFLTKGYVKP